MLRRMIIIFHFCSFGLYPVLQIQILAHNRHFQHKILNQINAAKRSSSFPHIFGGHLRKSYRAFEILQHRDMPFQTAIDYSEFKGDIALHKIRYIAGRALVKYLRFSEPNAGSRKKFEQNPLLCYRPQMPDTIELPVQLSSCPQLFQALAVSPTGGECCDTLC